MDAKKSYFAHMTPAGKKNTAPIVLPHILKKTRKSYPTQQTNNQLGKNMNKLGYLLNTFCQQIFVSFFFV